MLKKWEERISDIVYTKGKGRKVRGARATGRDWGSDGEGNKRRALEKWRDEKKK